MPTFQNQRAALEAAAQIVEQLPAGTMFGVEVTDEDSHDEPSVMNIYCRSFKAYETMPLRLKLETPVDEGGDFISYRVGPLLVSIVNTKEEKHE